MVDGGKISGVGEWIGHEGLGLNRGEQQSRAPTLYAVPCEPRPMRGSDFGPLIAACLFSLVSTADGPLKRVIFAHAFRLLSPCFVLVR